MTHIMRIDEMLGKPMFDSMPSMSDEQRPKNVGIEKCHDILKTKQAQDILKKYGVTMWKTKEHIALYIPIKVKSKYYTEFEEPELAMQKCINELDQKTELYFETGWAGNVGVMANKIVYSYIGPSSVENILKDGCDYDFETYYGMKSTLKSLLSKGYNYVVEYVFNRYRMEVKCYTKSSDVSLNEIKDEILKYAKDYIKRRNPKYSIELMRGKRGYETSSNDYESFIIFNGSSSNMANQVGGFELNQNKFGDTTCDVHHILGGNTSFDFDINNWKSELESVIDTMVKH